MLKKSLLFAALLAVAAVSASAQPKIQVLGAGSSAMFNTASYGAWKNLAGTGALHYTIKGTCPSGNCASLHDVRSTTIPLEQANLSVVWDAAVTKIWVYAQVDSVVGNRMFFATPRAQLVVDPCTDGTGTGTCNPGNLIASSLWGSDATSLPTAVYNAINNAPVTAAFTDIRPEDAKYAQTRAVTPIASAGLGYGTGSTTLVGTQILSHFSSSAATPVNFSITGTDPFSGQTIPNHTTYPIGASPIIFVVNRTNVNGLGAPGVYTNITLPQAQVLYGGGSTTLGCATGVLTPAPGTTALPSTPITVVQREPLSGTMNTTEFTVFRTKTISPNPANSQEKGVNPALANNNPLDLACNKGIGIRERAIGTGELIKSGVLPQADSIGYTFFSYGNVAPLAGSSSYGYLTLNGVDGINASYTNGQLPTCTAPCPATPGTTFPNVRNGSYLSWSILRSVTDAAGSKNLQALVAAIQSNVNETYPDFVPFSAQPDGDPGMKYYRSHYTQSNIPACNGLPGTCCGQEAGGDVGGYIEADTACPGVTQKHQ